MIPVRTIDGALFSCVSQTETALRGSGMCFECLGAAEFAKLTGKVALLNSASKPVDEDTFKHAVPRRTLRNPHSHCC